MLMNNKRIKTCWALQFCQKAEMKGDKFLFIAVSINL